jgi:ubiquinone/menaquinone biosynthesis C-methylase UbiE
MQLRPGDRVLVVGCGSPNDTLALANFVGPGGSLAGVEIDPHKVEAAERLAAANGVSTWVHHQHCDTAQLLPFASYEFNSCCSLRFLECVPDPSAVLAEMVRVTRPGGWIAALDTDWATLSIDLPETDVERRMVRARAESCSCNGYAARQLYRNFRSLKLNEIQVELFPIVFTSAAVARKMLGLERLEKYASEAEDVTEKDVECWLAAIHQAEQSGTFFASVCLELVAGRKSAGEGSHSSWARRGRPGADQEPFDLDMDLDQDF